MRKIYILAPLALLVLLMVAYTQHTPAESHATPMTTATPSTGIGLPDCLTEDGAGQALCVWDGTRMGNGVGALIISGDCAPDYVGGQDASLVCRTLHARKAYEITNPDGSINGVPNGADLVQECNDMVPLDGSESYDYPSRMECYQGQLDS